MEQNNTYGDGSMTKIFGHRGAKGTYPENTLLSFRKAIEMGVDGLELDVHLTKDGEVVVIHDETLDRTTNGTGWIKDLQLDEIKRFSAGKPFSHFFHYEKIWDLERVPTLQEVLELIAPYQAELNIELKTNHVAYEGIEEKVYREVERFGNGRNVIYSSFDLPTILRIKGIDHSAKIAWLLNEAIPFSEDVMNKFDLEAFHLNKKILLSKIYAQNNPFLRLVDKIRTWTVNEASEIQQLLDMKVNGIITDFPMRAISLRNK